VNVGAGTASGTWESRAETRYGSSQWGAGKDLLHRAVAHRVERIVVDAVVAEKLLGLLDLQKHTS
jgi:hypothetical protein